MELHNASEDIVFKAMEEIFNSIAEAGNKERLCLCEQCRLDTVCYILNRIPPRYIVSSRGISHLEKDWSWKQQTKVDVATLAYKGLRLVNHNQRTTATHAVVQPPEKKSPDGHVFDIPTITGRLFDGKTFSPIADISVELWSRGKMVSMRNQNWQNPFTLSMKTPGTYTFWPASVPAEETDVNRLFDYYIKMEDPNYETMTHHFRVPAISDDKSSAQSSGKTFKLPDLYLFPPGDSDMSW